MKQFKNLQEGMTMKKHTSAEQFDAVHTLVENTVLDGQAVMRVVKKDKVDFFDENTYAVLKDTLLHNGTIEVRLRSRLLPDAPDFARGFVGIVFRAKENSSEFESFYVRPTNGRGCTDPVRKAHGCQYFSYPGYTFRYFREFGVTEYEAPVEVGLDEWFTIRAVLSEEQAFFYLNGDPNQVLTVPRLKHGSGSAGRLGIYVDIGTEAFVSDITVVPTED